MRLGTLGHGLRVLRRFSFESAYIILMLAVGVGIMSGSFTVFSQVLLGRSDFPVADRLVTLFHPAPAGQRELLSDYDSTRLQAQVPAIDRLATYSVLYAGVGGAPSTEMQRTRGIVASTSLMDVLGVPPATGRGFFPNDGKRGAVPVVLMSSRLARQLQVAPGNIANIGGDLYTVVGVMPESFAFPDLASQFYIAKQGIATIIDPTSKSASTRTESVIARLQPGISLQQTESQIRAACAVLRIREVVVRSYEDDRREPVRGTVVLAQIGAVFILALTLLNTSWLLYARTQRRVQDFRVMHSLGASRRQVLEYYFRDVWVLVVAAVPLAGLISLGLTKALSLVDNGRISQHWRSTTDASSIIFAASLCLLSGLVASGPSALSVLAVTKRGIRASHQSRVSVVRRYVVLSLVTAAIVTISGEAVRLTTGLIGLMRANIGYSRTGLLVAQISALSRGTLSDEAAWLQQVRIRDDLNQQGLTVALTNSLPLGGEITGTNTAPDDRRDRQHTFVTDLRIVTSDYFSLTGIRFVEGNLGAFDESGDVILNRALAGRLFPGTSAVGRRIVLGTGTAFVAGVVETRARDMFGPPTPEMYISYRGLRRSPLYFYGTFIRQLYVIGEPAEGKARFITAVRDVVRAEWPNGFVEFHTFRDFILQAVGIRILLATGLTCVTFLALLLMGGGLYGVVRQEMYFTFKDRCIRIAIGATPQTIIKDAAKPLLAVVTAALACGVPGMWMFDRLISSVPGQLTSANSSFVVGVATTSLALMVVVLAAAVGPIAKAARTEPMFGLRGEQ
jgi:hypothetical protein